MEELDIKEKILKGAEALFMKFGVRSISMDDIARHLSVSKKTLYQHFADKEDIVTMTCMAHMNYATREFEAIAAGAKNAIEELAGISGCLKKNMEEMNPSLLFDLQKYHPRAWSVWLDHKNKVIRESVIRNLKQGIVEGYFRPEINPDILAVMRMELVQLAFNEQVFPNDQFKFTEVQMQIFDHFVHGIVTEKGRKLYLKYKEENYQPSIQ
ncbi:MAG: TetR/AcrR family transcriptional regulator [Cyclobacteriaceae bacterium]|nr:TetR/AcrR family transcriptional regulator [Cyclobacteriaceae bacterium]